MRSKVPFLLIILIVPILIIALLYAFGDNQYIVKGNRLAGKELPSLQGILPSGIPMLVNLAGADSLWEDLRSRVGNRAKRIRKSAPDFELIVLRSGDSENTPTSENQVRTVAAALLNKVLHDDLNLPVDTTPLGPWFLLINREGQLENVYDLSQERLLDTLAIESTILAEQKP